MTTPTKNLIRLTDDYANPLVDDDLTFEPEPGSIVLTHGMTGTCWQRYFSDGLWRRVGGRTTHDWPWMLRQTNLVLVYDAPTREEKER